MTDYVVKLRNTFQGKIERNRVKASPVIQFCYSDTNDKICKRYMDSDQFEISPCHSFYICQIILGRLQMFFKTFCTEIVQCFIFNSNQLNLLYNMVYRLGTIATGQ